MIHIYTSHGCPICEMAIDLLKRLQMPFKNIPVEEKRKDEYKKKHRMKTFQQIFIQTGKKQFIKIGDNNELENILILCLI